LKITVLLSLLFIISCAISLAVGSVHVSFAQMLSVFSGFFAGDELFSPRDSVILFSVRMPRIIFAGIVGASLSLSGVVFQALLRNPLADPYILGISGGSALGAIIGIIIGAGSFYLGVPLLAFSGALITVFLVFVIAGGSRGMLLDNSLLLSGVIVNAFFSAAILFSLSIADSMELYSISFWMMGDLSRVSFGEISVAATFLVLSSAVLYGQARKLNLILQGEETAKQLGVNIQNTKCLLLIVTSLVTSFAVSFAGIIGFVGIMVPHMMRLAIGSDHRLLLPAAALFGASFLVAADTIARLILSPAELPVGVVTALCGAPYFIFLMKRRSG